MDTLCIKRLSREFLIVNNRYNRLWFGKDLNKLDYCEQYTTHILEYYKNKKDGILIDIGAWIGIFSLYSANLYNKIYSLEPDTIAYNRFIENLKCNNFRNIEIINKGINNENKISLFGGNGPLGNMESTLLINNDIWKNFKDGRQNGRWKDEQQHIIEIETITIEKLIEDYNINPNNISLIKFDIEGGEILVIPSMIKFLKLYKPPLYISLHYEFLPEKEVYNIIITLFDVYENCYYFTNDGEKKNITMIELKSDHSKSEIVFE
jgi:FkbM family methyltransferase